jgi:hypothetical protein
LADFFRERLADFIKDRFFRDRFAEARLDRFAEARFLLDFFTRMPPLTSCDAKNPDPTAAQGFRVKEPTKTAVPTPAKAPRLEVIPKTSLDIC